jgi:hypothetical protein
MEALFTLNVERSKMTILDSLHTTGPCASIARDQSLGAVPHSGLISDCGDTDRCISGSALRNSYYPIEVVPLKIEGVTNHMWQDTSIRVSAPKSTFWNYSLVP